MSKSREEQIYEAYEAATQDYIDRFIYGGEGIDLDAGKVLAAIAEVVPDVTWQEILDANEKQEDRLEPQAEIYGRWVWQQRKAGRPESELTWGNCIRELGLLRLN